MKAKPNFIIVGAPKCGTTSMHDLLGQHPDIFMPERKELSYFNTDHFEEESTFKSNFFNSLTLRPKNDQEYLDLFKNHQQEKTFGEATPWYFTSEIDAQNIHKFNPQTKILIFIREPSEFLYSLHSQLLYTQNEDQKDFLKALNLEESRRQHRNLPKHTTRPSITFYSDYINYPKNIKKYLSTFGENNVKIILLDDIKENIQEIYKSILKFIDVDPNFIPEFNYKNPNKIARIRALQNPMLKKIIAKLTPKPLQVPISNLYKKLNNKYQKRIPLDSETKNQLKKEYLEIVKQTAKLIDRDLLKIWNYQNL